MCLVSKPKIPVSSATDTTQNIPIIRNPLLDGLVSNEEQGNNPFRIDLINPLTIPGGGKLGSISSGFSGGASASTPPPSSAGSTTAGTGSPSGGFGGGGGGGVSSFGGRINKL